MLKYKFIPSERRATSLNPTPEPTPRLSRTPHKTRTFHGSEASLFSPSIYKTLDHCSHLYGSTNSLASTVSSNAYTRRRKGRAPQPPGLPPSAHRAPPSTPPRSPKIRSVDNSPSGSCRTTPTLRKKRIAPRPPSSTPRKGSDATVEAYNSTMFETAKVTQTLSANSSVTDHSLELYDTFNDVSAITLDDGNSPANSLNPVIVLDEDLSTSTTTDDPIDSLPMVNLQRYPSARRRILVDDNETANDVTEQSMESQSDAVVYRRTIVPLSPPDMSTTTDDDESRTMSIIDDSCGETSLTTIDGEGRQWQKMKENKESQNKNRQSQISLSSPGAEIAPALFSNKSSHGKWKRRKGPAPGLPVPRRKVLQMVPLDEIRHELDVIEVQQQGLEKQVGFYSLYISFCGFYFLYR